LDKVADLKSGGTPSKANPIFWGGDIPWLTPKDMTTFTDRTEDQVTQVAIGNGTRLAPPNAVFVAVRGMSLHNEIRVVYGTRAMAFNQDIKAVVANGLDPKFLFYALTAAKPQLLAFVESAGHGTGVLPTDKLSNLPIPNIGMTDQRAIAHILGTLDDKIELNRRTNETLEAMAQALFKDWFIDFGPVRAKMEGRDPYLAREVWDLFPERLNSHGLPQGWATGKLGDIAASRGDGVLPSQVEPETPYIGLEHIPRRSIALSNWDRADKVDSNKIRFSRGDFLFGKLRPYFHKVGVAPIDGICSTDIVVLRSIQRDWR
jgi:type I restriction enzyme S subunit